MTETLEHVEEFGSQEPREESASGEAFGASAPDAQPPAESDLSAANAAVIRQMVLAAKDAGMVLTGPGGLLKQLTKMVIETALDEEMSEHLGYDKHDPAGRGSGNSRNGMRSKTVMTDNVGPEALILFLIIFLWTPPHFWALALYRVEDYRKSGLPMLPVTHGNEFTRLQVFLYTLILFAGCLMPFVYGMSSWIYLIAAIVLSFGFCYYGFKLWRNYSDALARKTFRFSLIHLSVLFAALLVDHYVL